MRLNRTLPGVPADIGRMLRLLAGAGGAKNAVEIRNLHWVFGTLAYPALQRTGGKLTTFEIDPTRAEQARKNFEQAGVQGMVTVIVGDAADENIKRLKGSIEFLFLDGDKEGYRAYLKALLPHLRPGGLITADNVGMAEDYVQAVTTDPQLDTVFFGRFAATLKKR